MIQLVSIGRAILSIIYAILKLLPVKKKILFISRQSDEMSLDIIMLCVKIQAKHPDYDTVCLCKKLDHNYLSYLLHMLRQMYHLATSKAVVLDSYCMAVSLLTHRKSLLVIQMWHSVGTMKKFGYSILDKPEGSSTNTAKAFRMHKGYDHVFVAGNGYKAHLAEGMGVPEDKLVIMPLPRIEVLQNPRFLEEKRDKIYAAYPELKEKKNIVYVPTFRKSNDESARTALISLYEAIDHDRYNFIPKMHPLAATDTDLGKGAVDDKIFTSFEMLTIADVVISDYSCIVYEAAVLGVPLYFYAYDYDEYLSSRNLYIDYYEEMPGPIEKDPKALAKLIDEGACDTGNVKKFLRKYVETTGKETENIVDFIFDHIS